MGHESAIAMSYTISCHLSIGHPPINLNYLQPLDMLGIALNQGSVILAQSNSNNIFSGIFLAL